VSAYKPVAAGCQRIEEKLINDDAKLLSQFANCQQKINEINPIALIEPIAPHIAASRIKRELTLEEINSGYVNVLSLKADINITEGAGGWRLPLNLNLVKPSFLSDFVVSTKQDVVLVVNMKLGCLNHALLTYQAIIADGLNCVAWVANSASQEQMLNLDENIKSLEHLLPIPKIAQLSFYHDPVMSLHEKIHDAAKQIDCSVLI
jgi:dethiobiotin synthetase